ncbi:hypothetical protein AALP_AAs67265U000100 [Arabis alpina]|uniref:DUF287 domain-containing protein n=1 Tax=Arabis alpina TaxID=50452 RepID=A0A087G2C6_ARAAL|nr:hypothetical protein AALP_AAs67265U000100 [Arabis alpina]
MNPRIAERPLVSRIFDEEENDRDADDYFVESWENQLCKNKPICFQTLFNLDVNGEKEAEQVADEALDVLLVSNAEEEEIKKGLLDVQEGMQKMSKSMEEGFEKMFNLIGGQDTRLKAVESFVNSHTWNAGEWSGGGGVEKQTGGGVEKQTDGAEWSGGGGVDKQTNGVCGGMEVEMEGEDGVGEEDKDKDGADEGEKEKDGDKEEDKDKDGGDEEEETDKDDIDEEDKEKDGADDEDKAKSKKKKDGGKKKKDVVEKEVVGEKRKRKPSEYGKSPYTLLRPRTRQNTKTKKN